LYEVTKYGVGMLSNGITVVRSFVKSGQVVETLNYVNAVTP
jgi:hypothetical protein